MDSLAKLAFLLCSCVTDLKYLTTDTTAKQASKGRWKLPACAVLELLKWRTVSTSNLRLALSKSCNCAREERTSDLKQSDFPKLSFCSDIFCSSENLWENMLSAGFYFKEIMLLLHNDSHTRSYYNFWKLLFLSRINFWDFCSQMWNVISA